MNSFISLGALAMCLAAATSPAFAQDDASVQSGGYRGDRRYSTETIRIPPENAHLDDGDDRRRH
ncbi:hypothetical protein [Sphingobium sp. TomMM35A]